MKTKYALVKELQNAVGFVLVCCQCEISISADNTKTAYDLAERAYNWNWAVDNNGDAYCGDCRD